MFGFLTACKLFIRMRIKKVVVKKTDLVNAILYTERLADIWKKNVLEDLESENLEYEIVKEF